MARKPKTPLSIVARVGKKITATNVVTEPPRGPLEALDGFKDVTFVNGKVVITFASEAQAKVAFESMVADGVGGVDDWVPDNHQFDDPDGFNALAEAVITGKKK